MPWLRSNLSFPYSFPMEFATFWCSNLSWNTVDCNWGSFRVSFKLGLALGLLSAGSRTSVCLVPISGWFWDVLKTYLGLLRVHLELVLGFTHVWLKNYLGLV